MGFSFNGKLAVVIGGSSGIGLSCILRLKALGAEVINGSRTDAEIDGVINITLDVSSPESVTNFFEKVKSYGRLDYLIYSAGFSLAAPVALTKPEDYNYLFEVNYFGAVRSVAAALPLMEGIRENGESAKIIFISSVGGVLPICYDAFYSGSKAAINILAEELSMELYNKNIKVCSLMPGGTATGFTFKRKVYAPADCGEFSQDKDKAVYNLAQMEQSGMTAFAVSKKIVKLLKQKNPPPLSSAGTGNQFLHFLSRHLPLRLSLFLNKKVYLKNIKTKK